MSRLSLNMPRCTLWSGLHVTVWTCSKKAFSRTNSRHSDVNCSMLSMFSQQDRSNSSTLMTRLASVALYLQFSCLNRISQMERLSLWLALVLALSWQCTVSESSNTCTDKDLSKQERFCMTYNFGRVHLWLTQRKNSVNDCEWPITAVWSMASFVIFGPQKTTL